LKDQKLCIVAKKPFFILEQSLSTDGDENEPIEPKNVKETKRQKEATPPFRPTLLGGGHDVRTFPPNPQELVASIYHFFQRECGLDSFKLSDWKGLLHEQSITVSLRQNQPVSCG
jgi:hypothetical protein